MARLPRLIGRALEVLLTGDDVNGVLAEQYGYVNRSFPDADLDQFVDTLARRIATLDKQTIADIKRMVNVSSLPSMRRLALTGTDSFHRPNARSFDRRLGRGPALPPVWSVNELSRCCAY